jgi:hypothetical protein
MILLDKAIKVRALALGQALCKALLDENLGDSLVVPGLSLPKVF